MNINIETKRHSLAHILAQAVQEIYGKGVFLGFGPNIENGFYHDLDMGDIVISDKDLKEIEKKMKQLLRQFQKIEQEIISMDIAEKKVKEMGDPYKIETLKDIKNKGETKVSFYKNINQKGEIAFDNLCGGPHTENTNQIDQNSFALDKVAGAYWKGDEKNKMITRIYGFAFDTKEELDKHLDMLVEARKRDHRILGKKLGLFIFSDLVGKGLPLWTEKGSIIRRELERFIVDEEIKRGYIHVYTPDIAKVELYKKSGHYPYYKDSMYAPITVDDEEFMLRPMTCPHHFELYASEKRSYKELPMRIAELAKLYRYEKSGELNGLIRLRGFCLADAHIICSGKDQAKEEVGGALDLIEYIASMFGFRMGEHYWYRLSLGDRGDDSKYYKDDNSWNESEIILRDVLKNRDCHFVEAEKEAAFYGPKIDVQMRNINGKEDTAFTVQYDFVMPKRFELKYKDKDGEEKEVVVVHRSSVGAIERVIAFLIEHFAGIFPLWMAPRQVIIIPVGEKFNDYAEKVEKEIKKAGIRVEADYSTDGLNKKVRNAEKMHNNYILVVGEQEENNSTVSVRNYKTKKQTVEKLDEFISRIESEIKERKL